MHRQSSYVRPGATIFRLLLGVLSFALLHGLDVSEVSVSFDATEMVGDPSSSSVYLIDASTPRLYAIDTALGTTRARARLVDGAGNPILPSSVEGGHLALSQDRQHLFVSLPTALRIQKYAVTDLHLEAEIPLSSPPTSFGVAANGYLCVAGASTISSYGTISTVDPATGSVVTTVGSYGLFSGQPLLRMGDQGTRVYGLDASSIRAYDLGPGGSLTPGPVFAVPNNGVDFAVSEADQRLYHMAGGQYGLTSINLTDGTSSFTSFDGSAYGLAVAQVPGSALVWAASGQDISSFARVGSTLLETVAVGAGGMPARCLAMAADGHVLYCTDARRIGLIGTRTLCIEPDAPMARIAATRSGPGYAVTFSAAASDGGPAALTTYQWSIDGAPVADSVQFTRTFPGPGLHTVRLVVGNGPGPGRDLQHRHRRLCPPGSTVSADGNERGRRRLVSRRCHRPDHGHGRARWPDLHLMGWCRGGRCHRHADHPRHAGTSSGGGRGVHARGR